MGNSRLVHGKSLYLWHFQEIYTLIIFTYLPQTLNNAFFFGLMPPGGGNTFTSSNASNMITQNIHHTTQPKAVAFSERETLILSLIASGKTTKEIADELYLSTGTIDTHRKRMIKKVQAKNIFGVFNYAIRTGIINPFLFGEPYVI